MKVVITAPSLDEKRNVSGISTIVRQIIEHGSDDFSHFTAGREDGEPANAAWLLKQAAMPFRFYSYIRRENADLVHINTALTDLSIWRDAALTAAAKIARRPVVLAVHGGKYLMNDFESRLLETVTRKMLHSADAVVVYSSLEETALRTRWSDLNIRVLPNAIPFAEVPQAARNNHTPVMIFFGRMHESKGLHEVIEAARSLHESGRDFEFRAYGEGPLRDFFVDGMRSAIGDKFHYGGIISGKEKWERLADADIFVLPSRYGEGLPMAMLEAMAVGCVVVIADVASVVSVVTDGENGCVVEPKNARQLAKVLDSLLADRSGWGRIQNNAVATIRDRFGIDGYIETLENIYRSVAGK